MTAWSSPVSLASVTVSSSSPSYTGDPLDLGALEDGFAYMSELDVSGGSSYFSTELQGSWDGTSWFTLVQLQNYAGVLSGYPQSYRNGPTTYEETPVRYLRAYGQLSSGSMAFNPWIARKVG